MCYEVKCEACGKSTWAGCGRHVASVHRQIPVGHHCACRDWPGVAAAAATTEAVAAGEKASGDAAAAEKASGSGEKSSA